MIPSNEMTEASNSNSPAMDLDGADVAALIARAESRAEKTELTAAWILREFDNYYVVSRGIPERAKAAFEQQAFATTIGLSRQRLAMYSAAIETLGPKLKVVYPRLTETEQVWNDVERTYLPRIGGRYEADLAYAFLNSVRRMVYQGEWRPVEYAFTDLVGSSPGGAGQIVRSFPVSGRISRATVIEVLAVPGFCVGYRALEKDARLVSERANQVLEAQGVGRIRGIDVIDAGFYRNRGCYLVGRILVDGATVLPFLIALLNEDAGIYVGAVLMKEADVHNIFSSTLANFHVTTPYYHELSDFLHSIMPKRPLGLHYSTIGFNHVGKVAVMDELQDELTGTGEVLETAVGSKGTVAIGFSSPSSGYNLKVIRNEPTAQYKWGKFEGIESVLEKYRRVHEINRTGSMLDNIIYYNLELNKDWFDPALLRELLAAASHTVFLRGTAVIFKYLIVQRRMTPLPVFLESASEEDARTAMVNLGDCIKNNAAANVINKDLDARNYGVSRFLKVYLYDYDALELFTEVKIRSNEDRYDGEEDVPDWYFEDEIVFLPEEIEIGLRIPDRTLHRHLRAVHGDLLTISYWENIQRALRAGKVPSIRIYPESADLHRD